MWMPADLVNEHVSDPSSTMRVFERLILVIKMLVFSDELPSSHTTFADSSQPWYDSCSIDPIVVLFNVF